MRGFAKAAAIACLSLTAALGTAPAAFSQEDGVTLDPGDPAAKEYALPHEEARREAGDAPDAPVQQGSRDSALFGEGVKPDAASSGSGTQKSADRAKTSTPDAPSDSASSDDLAALRAGAGGPGGGASEGSASGSGDSEGGVGATTALVGGGAAALFAALLGGFGLRAVRGPRDA